jgi:hypothetical protein
VLNAFQLSDWVFEDYVINKLAAFYCEKMTAMGLTKWEATNDCDNFAWNFFTDATWAHYISKQSTAEGLAVGVCYFMSGARAENGTGGGHAINTAIVENHEVIFIEPQFAALGKPCQLTLNAFELQSIWFVNY